MSRWPSMVLRPWASRVTTVSSMQHHGPGLGIAGGGGGAGQGGGHGGRVLGPQGQSADQGQGLNQTGFTGHLPGA